MKSTKSHAERRETEQRTLNSFAEAATSPDCPDQSDSDRGPILGCRMVISHLLTFTLGFVASVGILPMALPGILATVATLSWSPSAQSVYF